VKIENTVAKSEVLIKHDQVVLWEETLESDFGADSATMEFRQIRSRR
jgi:hypothetical protein